MLTNNHSFRFIPRGFSRSVDDPVLSRTDDFSATQIPESVIELSEKNQPEQNVQENRIQSVEDTSASRGPDVPDTNKRFFLKALGVAGVGVVASQLLPNKASALVMGSTPSSSVVGVKDANNDRVNPATEETLASLVTGQGVSKLSTNLAASGTVHTPGSGKKIRVYASRFSLTADATSVSFRFTSGGTDHEKYVSPKTGGLYGANNHPNYVEGGVDEVLYCVISGTTTVQINVDYLEV